MTTLLTPVTGVYYDRESDKLFFQLPDGTFRKLFVHEKTYDTGFSDIKYPHINTSQVTPSQVEILNTAK